MTRPPAPRPDATGSIAALIGVMLGALLAALFGMPRRGAMRVPAADLGYADVLGPVLRAEAEAEMSFEPWVEWVAVPAPWRNGRLLPRRHEARRLRRRGVRPAARMRGPPGRFHIFRVERTGKA